jgi:dipeptidyl aminopeptidase/acylaminoacyl peptidase
VQFAADSKRILFISERTGTAQIWTAEFDSATGAASNPKKLTNVATGTGDAIWSPDGHSVVFTSSVFPDCPAIVPNDNGVGDECNSDHDAALADSKVKAQIFTHLLYRHWDHYTGDKRSHLFLLTVATGAVRDLTPNDPHDVPPFSLDGGGCGCAFAPDGKELAFTENTDPEPATSVSAKIFTLDLTNLAAKPVAISTSAGGNFNPAYSPDGKWLAWRSQERAGYEADKFRIFLYNRTTKQEKNLLPDYDAWIDEFAWASDSKSIYFISNGSVNGPIRQQTMNGKTFVSFPDTSHLYQTDTTNRNVQSIASIHYFYRGECSDLHILPDAKTVLVTRMSIQHPSEVYSIENRKPDFVNRTAETSEGIRYGTFPLLGFKDSQITHLNDYLLAKLDLPELESFVFQANDKTILQGFLIRPPGFDAAKKYPVKFLIHGGPQGAWGDDWSYRWNAELFAANGYVVVMINPRGSTGYGQAIVDGVNGDWGGKPFTDLMQGLDYAEQHYPFIDKRRECALGASYGGYMANWILGHTDRFKCIVSHDGMFNPESAYGATEELWFNEWEFKGKPWDYYGKPDAENPYRKWSPALSAKNFKTPTLVIHGQRDYRLDVAEGFQLFTTLQRLKVPSKMLYFPDEGHWVLKPQNSRLWWKTVNDWVDEWTK